MGRNLCFGKFAGRFSKQFLLLGKSKIDHFDLTLLILFIPAEKTLLSEQGQSS